MARKQFVVGVDLGGTNMQIGVVDERNRIRGRTGRKTKAKQGSEAVIGRMMDAIEEACVEAKIKTSELKAIGVAAPGAIDIPRGVVLEAPNLKWYDFPLRDVLRKKLPTTVVIDNDVNAAIWGEFRLGAARPKNRRGQEGHDVLGIWVGTGVGGGLVIGDRLYHGRFFTAGEAGWCTLYPEGKKGRRTVEDFCSRTGIDRTIGLRLKDFPKSHIFEVTGGSGRITGSKQLARAYASKDRLAVSVINESADLLGIAIANYVTLLSLDMVVLGGGVSEALGKPYLDRVRASFRKHVFPDRCAKAELVLTQLKDDAGVLGAALLAREAIGR